MENKGVNPMTWLDLLGYVGSVLVAISLMMANIKRLRWINLFGAGVFSSYGFLIGAMPVFFLNGWIVLVNIYYLFRLYQFKDNFDMVKLSSVRTPLFELLIERYGADIGQYFPQATVAQLDGAVALLIFRNMKPVGLFAYQLQGEAGVVEVLIDYVIPEARDFKTAQFLFSRHTSRLRDEGIQTLISYSDRPAHISYLVKMGFVAEARGHRLALA
jgi:hypothetical protein